MSRHRPRGATLHALGATVAIALAVPSAAQAQNASSQAAAQALFDEGRKLMDQGRYAEACPKLDGSRKLDPGAGTLLNLAACYEKNGQTASAWVTYTDAAAAAAARHPDWAKGAKEHAAALEPKLSFLTIDVRSKADGLVVKRDGVALPLDTAGTAIPVDPGKHTVEGSAPGRRPFTATVDVGANGARSTVVVPELEMDAGAPAGGGGSGAATGSGGGGGSALKVAGLTIAGVGGAGILVGAIFGGMAIGAKGAAGNDCSPDLLRCNQSGIDALDGARTYATISTVGFIAGGVLVAGGLVLFLVAPKKEAGPSVSLSLGHAGAAGLTLGGSF